MEIGREIISTVIHSILLIQEGQLSVIGSSMFTSTGYRIYPKYSDTSTPYHICSKILTSRIHYLMLNLKNAG